MLEELTAEVESLKANHGVVPGLAVVIVGERSDSKAYVRMKKLAAKKIGFHSVDVDMPATATQAEILAEVEKLNADPKVGAPRFRFCCSCRLCWLLPQPFPILEALQS